MSMVQFVTEKHRNGHDLDKPLARMSGYNGDSYSKMLHSKQGFYNTEASSYLAKELQIIDVHRNTFLGGHSILKPRSGESIEDMKKLQSSLWLRDIVNKAHSFLDEKDQEHANECIEKALQINACNGDALCARGRLNFIRGYIDKAQQDFSAALQAPDGDKESINKRIAKENYDHAMGYFNNFNHDRSTYFFELALKHDPNIEGGVLHAELSRKRRDNAEPVYRK